LPQQNIERAAAAENAVDELRRQAAVGRERSASLEGGVEQILDEGFFLTSLYQDVEGDAAGRSSGGAVRSMKRSPLGK